MRSTAEWDDLTAAFPDAFEATPSYPPRVLARSFPEGWQLAGLAIKPWTE